jgi:hypothetical protein
MVMSEFQSFNKKINDHRWIIFMMDENDILNEIHQLWMKSEHSR